MIIGKININLHKHNNTSMVKEIWFTLFIYIMLINNASTHFNIYNNDTYSEYKKYPFSCIDIAVFWLNLL